MMLLFLSRVFINILPSTLANEFWKCFYTIHFNSFYTIDATVLLSQELIVRITEYRKIGIFWKTSYYALL